MRKNWLETACALLASVVVAGTAGQAQAAPALPTAGSQASSQELRSSVQYRPGIVDEDEEAAAVMEAPPAIYEGRPAYAYQPGYAVPGVYGFVAERPSSCGEYRYWNGVRCVDARDNPPDLRPRW